MSDIYNLEIDVDLKENLIITATCKQLDDLNLIFNVWNNGEIADLTEYKCRLKAFKQDQIPLIQNTNININNNVVNIIADEQLTTTSGIVKVELQFINKNTGKKKSTFNIVFKVIQSVLEVERSVSKATCTLLKEIDNKLDRIEDIGDVLEEAKEVRDTLTSTTIPGATSINSKLETNINNADVKITEIKNIISSASNKIEEVETSIINANTCREELYNSSTIATTNKENLDAANTLAEKNIEELNSLGNVTDLAKNVQTNTTDIANLKENVEDNTSQLKELANDLDKVFIAQSNETFDFNLATEGIHFCTDSCTNMPTAGIFGLLEVVKRNDNFYFQTFTTVTRIKYTRTKNNGIWSGWQQLATVDDTGWIDLMPLNNVKAYYDNKQQIRRNGNIVYLKAIVTNITSTVVGFSIPSGFRPRQSHRYTGLKNGWNSIGISIETNGNIEIGGVTNPEDFACIDTVFYID